MPSVTEVRAKDPAGGLKFRLNYRGGQVFYTKGGTLEGRMWGSLEKSPGKPLQLFENVAELDSDEILN